MATQMAEGRKNIDLRRFRVTSSSRARRQTMIRDIQNNVHRMGLTAAGVIFGFSILMAILSGSLNNYSTFLSKDFYIIEILLGGIGVGLFVYGLLWAVGWIAEGFLE